MQVFASLRDANVVLDGPVGCHVMPAVAVDQLYRLLRTCRTSRARELSETEVTLAGTLGALKEKVAAAVVRRPPGLHRVDARLGLIGAVVDDGASRTFRARRSSSTRIRSTTTSGSRSDRALLFLWQNREHFVAARRRSALPKTRTRPSVNIIGPTYGNFNSYSDLAEIKRLIAGIGADVNLVYPFEAALRHERLGEAARRSSCTQEYGASLAREVGLPVFDAPIGLEPTTEFLRGLGAALGLAGRGGSLHPPRKEDDAGGVARHLALDA